ncbi:MAG TPA: zf-HC2 domain-containing protein [Bacillota bacterium]|nr:zf-HC2 domain-containing protein [Bacillota bacterium]
MKDCNLVGELLPLYVENLLGDESGQLVKEHLAQCPGCQRLYETLAAQPQVAAPALAPTEKEQAVRKIVTGYRKWFYTIMLVAVCSALLGGIAGTYFVMRYEELSPNVIARDFVQYGLKGDRWVYQERISGALKQHLSFEKYSDLRSWEEFEQDSQGVEPSGFKVSKNITAQEFGPFDVPLRVDLVLEKGSFRVYRVAIANKAEYLKNKKALTEAVEEKNKSGQEAALKGLDKGYVTVAPADPTKGEYFVEGRILAITGNKIAIEQHSDTNSIPTEAFEVASNTLIVRHQVVKDTDYYRQIQLKELKVGDVIFIIFTKAKVPRVVAVT